MRISLEKKYFPNLNKKYVIDNKTFWQTVNPFLSENYKSWEKTILVEKEESVSDESKVENFFNNFFFKYCQKSWYTKIRGRGYMTPKIE